LIKPRSFIFGVIVSLVFVGLFFLTVDEKEMGKALADADLKYLAPAVAFYFGAVLFRTLRWRYLLSPLRVFAAARLFPVVVVGYMANNLLPVRLGELARAYYLRQREDFSTSTALATIAVERVYDGITLLLLALAAVPFLLGYDLLDGARSSQKWSWALLAGLAAVVFVAAIVALTMLAIKPGFARTIYKLSRIFPSKLQPKVQKLIGLFIEGLTALREPRRHVGLFLWSVPIWLFEGALYLFIAFTFNLHQAFEPAWLLLPVVMLVMAASNLASSIPSSPGSIGTFEFPAAAALVLVGVGQGTAGAYAVLVHVVLLLPVTALGLVFLWTGHISLARLAKGSESLSETPKGPPESLAAQEAQKP
jgi:uncharacterized protein (TIRG00374 family)